MGDDDDTTDEKLISDSRVEMGVEDEGSESIEESCVLMFHEEEKF